MARFNPKMYDSSALNSYKTVPVGVYLVKVSDVKVKYSSNGNEMWLVTFEIKDQGEYYGRNLYDNIVFAEKTMNRVKLIFERLGVDMSVGEREFHSDEILGAITKVVVSEIEQYTNAEGKQREKSKIAFDGYYPTDRIEIESSEEIPF